jgi:uncharacterized membrane protein SpoIIM required for sporulation
VTELVLKSHRFRREREGDWKKLELLLKRLEGGSMKSLSNDEIIALPVLYRSALSSLSVARATSLDQALIDYLESLSTRAYFYVYGARSTLVERLGRFFTTDWPRAVRSIWLETLVSGAMILLGAVVAYYMTLQDPDWYYSLMSAEMAHGRDPAASAAVLKEAIYPGPENRTFLTTGAAFLFTHNAGVALLSFSLGFAFCVIPLYMMVTNGAQVGALLAVYAKHGLGLQLLAWLSIHGVTELWAFAIAAGAGVRIGWALAFPGDQTRLEALRRVGLKVSPAMTGVVLMLIIAGLLEGIARQLVQEDMIRFGVAAVTAVVWILYLYVFPIAKERRHGAA